MGDYKVDIKAEVDLSEAEKKLNEFTKEKRKTNIQVNDSDLDEATKKAKRLDNQNINVKTKVSGTKDVDNLSKSFNNATKSSKNFGNSLKSFARVGAWINGFQLIENGAKKAVKAIKEVDNVIVDLQNATGSNYSDTKNLVSTYNSLAKSIGSTTVEVSKGADTWLRQGKSIAETNKLLQESMVLSKVSKLSSDDSSSYLTAIINGYDIAVDKVSDVNDALTSIDMAAAVDAGGLAEATSRVATSADLVGISLNRLLGYEAAIGETTQESMSVIGNSLKTIFQRMNNIKAGKLQLVDEDGTVEDLSDVETVLGNIGIPLRDTNNEFRNFGDVLDETAVKWKNLSSVQKAAVSVAFSGTRQANRFQTLMEKYDEALKYEQIANTSKGTAQQKFEENYLNSIEAKYNSMIASFEGLSTNLISRDAIGDIFEASSALLDFADKTGLAKGALSGLTGGIALKGFLALTTGISQATMHMSNFNKALELVKAGNIGTDGMQRLVALTDGLSNSQLKAVLSSKALSTEQRIAILTAGGMSQAEAQATLSTMGLSAAQGTATGTTVSFTSALKGLFATIASNPFLMLGTVITGSVMAFQALQKADEKFGWTYDTSLNLVKESVTAYDEAKQAINNLNSELETTRDRISELEGLKDAGTISLAEEEELKHLREQNLLLENQLQIKQKLANSQAIDTAEQARDTLAKGEQSVAQQVAQNIPGGKKNYQGMVNNVNVVDAVNENVKAIQEYENEITKLEKAQAGYDPKSKEWNQASKDIEKYNDAIKELQSDLNTKSTDLETLLSAFSVDGEGLQALSGYEEEFNAVYKAINNISNIDLSYTEKQLKAVEDFFTSARGNDSIEEYLLNAVKAGSKASDAIKLLGIDLSEAGLSADTLNKYFQEMANSASEVVDETSKINNNLTLDDVKSAFESENAGDTYVAMHDYLQKAKELFDQGLTGTDDFKTVAQAISYNVDSSTESFKKNYEKLKSYYIEDGDGNLTGQGIHNFLTDLQALNKGYATFNKETGKWDLSMENTAQAAKDMEMSVQMLEAILGRVQDYDNAGEFTFVSALEEFAEIQTSLEGLKAIYDEMEDGDRKTALGEKLKEWTPLIEEAENDLASLPDEVVTQLKFEFDKQSLKEQQEIYDEQWKNGNRTAEVGANRIATGVAYRETVEAQTGYDETKDAAYARSYDKIESLQLQFDSASTDEARQQIQASIDAVIKLQNAFQDAFAEGNAVDWTSFLQSDQAKSILDGLDSEIQSLLQIPTHTQMEIGVGLSKDKVESELKNLAAGSTIEFTAELDGVERQVTALKEEDGTITYTADVNGESVEVMLNQNGTVYYSSAGQDEPQGSIASLFYKWFGQDPANDDTAGLDYKKTSQDDPDDKEANLWYRIKGVIGSVSSFISGKSNVAGTARVGGTAYSDGTVGDTSWIKKEWETQKSESALVAEEAPEIMVDRKKGTFEILGEKGPEIRNIPRGNVIFDGKQSKELLTKGFTNRRGKTIGGRAYLGSSIGGFSFSGGASNYNKVSSYKNSANSKSSTNTSSKASEDAKDTSETFDWIETLLDRIQRAISNLDKIASATYRSWADRNKALAEQIGTVNEEISLQEQAYNRYLKEAESSGLSGEWIQKVKDGQINIEEISDENLQKQIENYQKWYEKALDCKDAVIDLKDELAELAQIEFDNVRTEFENALLTIEHKADILEGIVDKIETEGYLISGSLYAQLIENEKANITMLQNEYIALKETMRDAISTGDIAENSEQWYEMQSDINDVEKAISDANTALIEYQNTLRELNWELFDREQDMISDLQAESDFLIELMGDNKKYNEDASITDEGRASLGLHAVNYNAYMSQANDYADELKQINEDIANDPSNLLLLERRQELLESQKSLIESAEDEKQAMKELVSEGYDALLGYMDKLIDKRTKLLTKTKNLYDYEKQVNDHVKEIGNLEKQLTAYRGNDSEEARATIQKLQVQLEEAKTNLEETEFDKYISDQQKLLTDMKDETEQWMNERLDNIDFLVGEVIANTNANAETISNTLHVEADKVGYELSEEMKAIWNPNGSFGSVVTTYSENFQSQLTTTNNVLESIRNYLARMVGDSEDKSNTESNSTPLINPETSIPQAPSTTPQSTTQPTSSGDGTPKVGDKVTFVSGNYFLDSEGTAQTGNKNRGDQVYITSINNASWAKKPYHISTGNKLGNGDLGWVTLDQLAGYSSGGFIKDTGLFVGHGSPSDPEIVLKPSDSENFIELRDSLRELKEFQSSNYTSNVDSIFGAVKATAGLPKFEKVNIQHNVVVEVGGIEMYEVNDMETFANNMVDTFKNNARVRKLYTDAPLASMMGKNSLNYMKY